MADKPAGPNPNPAPDAAVNPDQPPARQADPNTGQPLAANQTGDDLMSAAQRKAPHVDREFMSKHSLDDDWLRRVASGEEPPPPYNGPDTSATDLHLTDGGWQNVPAGVKPEDANKDQISRTA
jgi:hypothetical protein